MTKQNSVLVALSGGIDSTVAANLLQEEGFQVVGIYFHLTEESTPEALSNSKHLSSDNREKVKKVAQKLNIPLLEVDYREEFHKIIVLDFIEKYKKGLTPNPCIVCNQKIKFKLLYDYALKENLSYISTGHYVRVEKDEKDGRYLLKRGLDIKKDQAYFLYRLKEDVLAKSIFPLGNVKKEDARKYAHKIDLPNTIGRESQEICFIPENNYRRLIAEIGKISDEPGYFLDTAGNILGRHKGISSYTVGQRRKTGLSLNSRKYVIRIIPEDNTVIIGDETDLYQREFTVSDVNYISSTPISQPTPLLVQIRYNTSPAQAMVYSIEGEKLKIIFDSPQRAITPGQSAVFYQEDIVLGGGIIERVK